MHASFSLAKLIDHYIRDSLMLFIILRALKYSKHSRVGLSATVAIKQWRLASSNDELYDGCCPSIKGLIPDTMVVLIQKVWSPDTMAAMAALQHKFHKLRQLRKEKSRNSPGLPSFFKNSILIAAFKFTPGKSIPCISCLLCWQEAHIFFFSLVSFFLCQLFIRVASWQDWYVSLCPCQQLRFVTDFCFLSVLKVSIGVKWNSFDSHFYLVLL